MSSTTGCGESGKRYAPVPLEPNKASKGRRLKLPAILKTFKHQDPGIVFHTQREYYSDNTLSA